MPGLAILLAVAVAVGSSGCSTAIDEADHPPNPPNIIVVMTDDQPISTLEQGLPRTLDWIEERGAKFNNMIVTTPLCCPSRASFITGAYGHNHGVLTNGPGYPELKDKGNVLPVWLSNAGYETAFVGKFMNGFGPGQLAPIVADRDATSITSTASAPGWDQWRAMVRPFSYLDFELNLNGRIRDYDDGQYLTEVLTREAIGIVEEGAMTTQPLFMWLSYWAPHREGVEKNDLDGACRGSAVPSRADADTLVTVEPPQSAAYDEADISDKPRAISWRPRLKGRRADFVAENFACQVASLRAVDRGVERLIEALEREGELENTVFILTSDNGFLHGEHRVTNGKSMPYEPAIRVPLLVSTPKGLLDGDEIREVDLPVANIDLAPTILELADGKPCGQRDQCRTLDGRSFVPLLEGRDEEWPSDRTMVIEAGGQPCPFTGVRTEAYVYVEWKTAEKGYCMPARFSSGWIRRELYDFADDPAQLDNLLVTDPEAVAQEANVLEGQLDELRNCAGIEGRDPEPLSGSYCE